MSSRLAPVLALAVFLLLTLAYVFLLYGPRVEEQRMLEEEAQQLISQQQTLRGQIAELERIRDNQPEITAALERHEALIPSRVALASAIRQIQVAADAAGVTLQSVTFADPVAIAGSEPLPDGTVLGSISTTVTMSGGYFQAVDFFRRLEVDAPRAVLFSDVSMAEASEEFPVVATTWTGDLFALIPGDAVVDPAAPAPGPSPSPSPGATATPAATTAPSVAPAPGAPPAPLPGPSAEEAQ